MTKRIAFFTFLLFGGLFAGNAYADGPDPSDLVAIKSCVEKQESARQSAEVCIETVARPCFNNDETSVPDSMVTQCLDREQLVWDSLLNDTYKKLHDGLDLDQQTKLRDMQRAWIESRKRTCEFFYDFFEGTMANPMIATCENKETARRAIFLRGFVSDLPQSK